MSPEDATLTLPTDDPAVHRQLLEVGMTSSSAIARQSVTALSAQLPAIDQQTLVILKRQAMAVSAQALNRLAERAGQDAARRAGYTHADFWSGATPVELGSVGATQDAAAYTTCPPCHSVLSPGAYLLDLFDVLNEVCGLDLTTLEQRFLQAWSTLPLDCQAAETWLRQGQIVREVLERFIVGATGWARDHMYQEMGTLTPSPPLGQPPAEPEILPHKFDAYLAELGTNRPEVHNTVQQGSAAVEALAARLTLDPDDVRTLAGWASGIRIAAVEALPDLVREAKTKLIDPEAEPEAYQAALDRAEAAIGRIETQFLDGLRDNLIRLALLAVPVYQTTQGLSTLLHLDLASDPTLFTTRIAQAIATIHAFVLAYRLGRETQAGAVWADRLQLVQWDDLRWRWMQSYGSWHAAQTVFLYPENFTLPGLRRNRTPAFQDFEGTLDGGDTSPATVRKAVADYGEAMAKASRPSVAFIASVNGRTFLFDRSVDAIYYTEQTATGDWVGWRKVEITGGQFLAGVVGFLGHIYLFFYNAVATPAQLDYTWMEPDGTPVTPLVKADLVITDPQEPSDTLDLRDIMLIGGPDHLTVYALFSTTLVGWCMDQFHIWQPTIVATDPRFISRGGETANPRVRPVGHVEGRDYLVAVDNAQTIWLVRIDTPATRAATIGGWQLLATVNALPQCVGTVRDGMLVIAYSAHYASPSAFRITQFVPEPSIALVWVNLPTTMTPFTALASLGDALLLHSFFGLRYLLFTFDGQSVTMRLEGKTSLGNMPALLLTHPVAGSAAMLHDFQQRQARVYAALEAGDFARVILDEWYFFLPLAIAQALTKAGFYQEAADWYHILYYPYAPALAQASLQHGTAVPPQRAAAVRAADAMVVDTVVSMAAPQLGRAEGTRVEPTPSEDNGNSSSESPVVEILSHTSPALVSDLAAPLRILITKGSAPVLRWCVRVQPNLSAPIPADCNRRFPAAQSSFEVQIPLGEIPDAGGQTPGLQPHQPTRIHVWAVAVGNEVGTTSLAITYQTPDTTAPVVTITPPANGVDVTDLHTLLQATIAEPGPFAGWCVRVQADPTPVPSPAECTRAISGSSPYQVAIFLDQIPDAAGAIPGLRPGANTIRLWAADAAGNVGAAATVVTYRDVSAPLAVVNAPASGAIVESPSTLLQATITDPFGVSGWCVREQFGPDPVPTPAECARPVSGSSPHHIEVALRDVPGFHVGANTIRLWASDTAGNVGGASLLVYHPSPRCIYAGFTIAAAPGTDIQETHAWLHDPYNPHAIARTRQNAYLRHTVLVYVENLLDWADHLFSRDTSESLNRARELYTLALDLLGFDELAVDPCTSQLQQLAQRIVRDYPTQESAQLKAVVQPLIAAHGRLDVREPLRAVQALAERDLPLPEKTTRIRETVTRALASTPPEPTRLTVARVLADRQQPSPALLAAEAVVRAAGPVALAGEVEWVPHPLAAEQFCVPPNPLLDVYHFRVASNLAKIRSGRNVAGLRRRLEAYAMPIDPLTAISQATSGEDALAELSASEPPPIYRYAYLLERAKYFITVAQQLEAAMLTADEKEAAEAYTLLKAKQDQQHARANVQLQELRLTEARDSTRLAQLQKEKVDFQREHFEQLLQNDLNVYEHLAVDLQFWAATLYAAAAVAALYKTPLNPEGLLTTGAQVFSASASAAATQATYERRKEEWQFQLGLAVKDLAIARQQIVLGSDREAIVEQERDIASLDSQFADDMVNFLVNKFTNVELYRWMSRTLRRLYRQHLSYAVAVARMAQQALSFERQEAVNIIGSQYWDAERAIGTGATTDRKGLLGAETLLADLNRLDQFRFSTMQRKRELTKVVSLAALAPVEFHALREQGWTEFGTPMALFDRDFPGHYLRLVKHVSLTFVALVPPNAGIHATLSNAGLSRVMVGAPFTEPKVLLRQPEAISVTAAHNGTGLFDITLDDPLLLPFEGSGVDTTWRLELAPGANRWDFQSLVDVLLTIRYTALEDRTYRTQVLQSLGADPHDPEAWVMVEGKVYVSARSRFPDEWYHFQNPVFLPHPRGAGSGAGQPPRPYSLRFTLTGVDFPPNEEIQSSITRVTVAAGGTPPGAVPLEVTFTPSTPDGSSARYTTHIDLVDGQAILSSSASLPLATLHPWGVWTLRVRNEADPVLYPEVIGTGSGSGRVAWDRAGTRTRVNVALATNGATASASSTYIETPPSTVIDGDRTGTKGLGHWADNTPLAYPDWIQVEFVGTRTIDEIHVITVQDALFDGPGPIEPTEELTFAHWGIIDFQVLCWDGADWALVPGGQVTGNTQVWRTFSLSPALATNKIRVVVTKAGLDHHPSVLSRIVAIEAYEVETRRNVALATEGGEATASSAAQPWPPQMAINGDRTWYHWKGQVSPRDNTDAWFRVAFSDTKTIDEVDLFLGQVPPGVDPTEHPELASQEVLTDFDVQYWTGAAWATVPGGSVTGNDQVWRRFTFPVVVTDTIQVVIKKGPMTGNTPVIVEIEAYEPETVETVWVEDALPAGAVPGGNEPWHWVGASPTPVSGALAHQSSLAAGQHQHGFTGAPGWQVRWGDVLYAYAYLDPDNLPNALMLQWYDGTWEHRAYWGTNSIDLGTEDTASRQAIGPLPPAGQWVRLEVSARQVGLEGKVVTGMAFTVATERTLALDWMTDAMLALQYTARTRYLR